VFAKEGSFSAMVGGNKRRSLHLLVGATLTIGTLVIGSFLTSSLSGEQSLWFRLGWLAAGIAITFFYLRWQLRSQEESTGAIKERVSQLEPELRKQVQARSYGTRRNLIEAPLRELDLDITPRVGWVRDPRLIQPEPLSEQIPDDIVATLESSKRRLLIVGEPGSGKTMAAYSLIEYLDEREGAAGRVPLLVNLSAWEAQENFEAFLVDYLCSSVGYEVPERALASAFISSDRYDLILDGLDEIPLRLRAHFSERLDKFVRGLAGEVGMVVTCRTQEYEEMLAAHPTGLGLVQAVEILPLSSEQLASALTELAKFDEDWGAFLSHRHLTAYKRVRHLLSNPLFLNLAVVGHLSPEQLLNSTTTEQDLRDLVLDSYLDSTLADQRYYEPQDARRYLSWIARFLNGGEVSPFGLKTSDFTVFDLADLTPPDPPRGYRLLWGLVGGLVGGLFWGLVFVLLGAGRDAATVGLIFALFWWLVWGLDAMLLRRWTSKRSALSSRLTFVWPSTRQRRHNFLRKVGQGLLIGLCIGLVLGLVFGLYLGWVVATDAKLVMEGRAMEGGQAITRTFLVRSMQVFGLVMGLVFGLAVGLAVGLAGGLVDTRPVLITSRTPAEARARSLITALLYVLITVLLSGLVVGLVVALVLVGVGLVVVLERALVVGLVVGLVGALFFGLTWGLTWGLNNGGWFVLLQKVAHRRLARAGNLPPRLYEFLDWGIEKQIFRRVGGGIRFRHNLIQQHLASTSADAGK
jgi:hypothetical protein